MITWLVEKTTIDSDNVSDLIDVLSYKKIPYQLINYKPFCRISDLYNNLPNLNFICYGTINLISKLESFPKIYPGFFCDFDKLRFSRYFDELKRYLLNYDANIVTWNNFKNNMWSYFYAKGINNCLFIRPNNCRKAFTGGIASYDTYFQDLNLGMSNIQDNTKIVISTPKHIDEEWRCFVTNNGELITYSKYKDNKEKLDFTESISKEAEKFVCKAAKSVFMKDKIFVIDIAKIRNNEYKVIELNSFSCSGFYSCDIEKLVDKVHEICEKD